jgi:uncharacterized low-complexity protein
MTWHFKTWHFKTWHFKTWHFASALIGALMLAVALPAPASAEQYDASARTAQSDQSAASRTPKPAKPVVRPGAEPNAKTSAKTSAKTPEAQGRPWTLQDAMPENSVSMRQYDTRPASPPIGRVPLQSGPGTLGFETKTQVNPNQTPDGATIRGQEATAARSSTYVGMSLSVPTTDKAMNFPVPWGKP